MLGLADRLDGPACDSGLMGIFPLRLAGIRWVSTLALKIKKLTEERFLHGCFDEVARVGVVLGVWHADSYIRNSYFDFSRALCGRVVRCVLIFVRWNR